jgi:hypothetical protein
MIYIGDGPTDVPCMKMTKQKGGYSIVVHEPGENDMADDMLLQGRVDFSMEADYSAGGEMERTVEMLMRRILATHELNQKHAEQLRLAGERRGSQPMNIITRGGLTDVPCMKMTKQKGGYSIAVHAPGATEVADDMLLQGRVDFSVEANYTPDSEIEQVVTMLMRRIRASHELTLRHAEQVQRAHRRRGKYVPLDIPMRGGLEDGEGVE